MKRDILIRRSSQQIADSVAADRDKFIISQAKKIEDAQEQGHFSNLWSAIKSCAPNLRRGSTHKPLPALKLANGDFAKNFEEAGDRWTEHFSQIELGFPSSFQDLLEKVRSERYSPDRVFPRLQRDCITTLFDLEQKCLDANSKKATGPDSVPPEVLKFAHGPISRLLAPVALKVTGLVCEPMQWSGGRYKELYKLAGSQTVVDSFRAVLLADLFGKTIQGTIRSKIIDLWGDYFSDYQFAGRSKRGCDLASHVIKTLLDVGVALQASVLIMFLDL